MAYQSILNPMPVTFTWAGLTDAQLRATAVPVSGTVTVGNASLAVTGTFWQTTQPVSLTSTTITGSVAVTGPLTDTQLRATAVPISIATDPDTVGSGTIAALNATVSVALNGKSAMRVQITGTWVGTLQFEGTVDGTNWIAINAVQAGSTTIPQNTTTNGVFSPTPAGFSNFRVNATAWTSGTATISIRASAGTGGIYHNQNLPGFQVIPAFKIDQTTPGTTNLVALSANQSVNNAQIGGVAPLMGNGITGTGSQRVTIASDNTAFNVIATFAIGTNSTTGDTGTKTATGNGATQTNVGNKGVQILFVLGVVTGTTPTFVGKIQGSVDGGTTFYDIPGATTASLTATGNFGIMLYPGIAVTAGTTTSGTTATSNMILPRTWRVVWTIGGTTPSFTITNIQYNYLVN